ncbi:MAG: tetratricopeptide repeat protein [Candidatus Fermentibacteria bacterium]|nr:tetratricopeptide repeat protein [Candidatus Fermentibacteria bacterium]
MDREKEIMSDHLPLEEVMIADIDGIKAPQDWFRPSEDDSPEVPPVVIEEIHGFSLVGNHRTVWHSKITGKSMVKCLVVRSVVHIKPAHFLVSNCVEEAMLFEALLRREIIPNRSRLADMLGYSRARITQLLNQLKLPLNIRQRVLLTDDVSEFKLRPLLKLLDEEPKLQAAFRKLMEGKLSGRQMAVLANSDIIDDHEKTGKQMPVDVPQNSNVDSLTELEGVFAGDDAVHAENEASADINAVIEQEEKKLHSSATSDSNEKETEADLSQVLKELGNIRDFGWKTRAAEFMLSPMDVRFIEGVSKLRTGLYTEAIAILEEAVSNNSDHHLAWFYLGRCANLTGSLQDAEEYLRNAVSRCSDNPDYLVELAIVLEKLKRHSEAEAFYRKSARIRKALAIKK